MGKIKIIIVLSIFIISLFIACDDKEIFKEIKYPPILVSPYNNQQTMNYKPVCIWQQSYPLDSINYYIIEIDDIIISKIEANTEAKFVIRDSLSVGTHKYRVIATNIYQYFPSETNYFEIIEKTGPKIIKPTDTTCINSDTVLFEWEKNDEAISYIFELAKDSDFNNIIKKIDTGLETNYYINNLELGKYYFRVGVNLIESEDTLITAYSDTIDFNITKDFPVPIIDDIQNEVCNMPDSISWTEIISDIDKTQYIFEISDDINFTNILITKTYTTNSIDIRNEINVKLGKYYIRVKALLDTCYSEYSEAKSFELREPQNPIIEANSVCIDENYIKLKIDTNTQSTITAIKLNDIDAILNGDEANVDISSLSAGTYTWNVKTIDQFNCIGDFSIETNIYPLPENPIDSIDTDYCYDAATTKIIFKDSSIANINEIKFNNTTISINSNFAEVDISTLSDGNYNWDISLTDSITGCQNSYSKTITKHVIPSNPIKNAPIYCANSTEAKIYFEPLLSSSVIDVTLDDKTATISGDEATADIYAWTPGSYKWKVKRIDSFNCTAIFENIMQIANGVLGAKNRRSGKCIYLDAKITPFKPSYFNVPRWTTCQIANRSYDVHWDTYLTYANDFTNNVIVLFYRTLTFCEDGKGQNAAGLIAFDMCTGNKLGSLKFRIDNFGSFSDAGQGSVQNKYAGALSIEASVPRAKVKFNDGVIKYYNYPTP